MLDYGSGYVDGVIFGIEMVGGFDVFYFVFCWDSNVEQVFDQCFFIVCWVMKIDLDGVVWIDINWFCGCKRLCVVISVIKYDYEMGWFLLI